MRRQFFLPNQFLLPVFFIWIAQNIPCSCSFGSPWWHRSTFAPHALPLHSSRRNRERYDELEDGANYYDDEYSYGGRSSSKTTKRQKQNLESRPYWEEELDDEWDQEKEVDSYTLEKDVIEWEKCPTDAGTAWVLLPPVSVTSPTAILHFCGGTFMGSAPHIWYRQLLHDLVRHTSCAIVATSIPVTLQSSPLNHVQLAKKIQRQFTTAYRNVLLDEYGDDLQAPICGLGHSLGSRLLVVMMTLNPKHHLNSCILISFTNFGAAAGIPGISQLYHQSLLAEKNQMNEKSSKSSKQKRKRQEKWSYGDDDDDDDDDDLILWLKELQDIVKEQASRIQSALTPASNAFEFYPTPDQLWKAIRQDGRYTVNQTLVVQFDDDEVDQSSTLASAIKNCTDVKFARLRGTHLTPVSVESSNYENEDSAPWLQQINTRVGRLLLKGLEGRKRVRSEKGSFVELRQSIARYITDVVTKEL